MRYFDTRLATQREPAPLTSTNRLNTTATFCQFRLAHHRHDIRSVICAVISTLVNAVVLALASEAYSPRQLALPYPKRGNMKKKKIAGQARFTASPMIRSINSGGLLRTLKNNTREMVRRTIAGSQKAMAM